MHSGKIYISGLSDDIKCNSAEDVSCSELPSDCSADAAPGKVTVGKKASMWRQQRGADVYFRSSTS